MPAMRANGRHGARHRQNNLVFSILSPLLQTRHFHRTYSHKYSYYLTANSGTYVYLEKYVLVVPLYCGENTK